MSLICVHTLYQYRFGEAKGCDVQHVNTQGRQNIAPDKIPWAALKTLMAQSIYGGRIDNEFDQRLLNTFLDRVFTKGSFDSEFKLALKVDGHKDLKMPDGIRSVLENCIVFFGFF